MAELATGGKVWSVPQDVINTVRSSVVSMTPKEKRKFRRNNKSGAQLMFGFLVPLGLLPTLAYLFMYPQMVKDDAARMPPTNPADGYYSVGLLWSQASATVVIVFAFALISVLFCVVRYHRALYMVSSKWGMTIGLSFMLLFIFPSTLPLLMPTSEPRESFSSWANEKYQLSYLESYNTGKTSLHATKESGEKVVMKVFVQDEFIYLYETNADLADLLQKLEGTDAK